MDPAAKLEEYSDNLDSETVKQKLKEHWHAPALLAVFLLALTLRYMPANGMKYLQAVDPYFIFRMSQHLALEGNLPQLDFLRYFPYANPTYTLQNGDIIIPALLYNAGFGLFFQNYLEWAQFYPAMMGALSVVVMYFLGKELFDKNTGLAAAFFLAVTTGALRRTSAGFFEKEPIGTFLMMTSLLFFTRAWKQESWKNGILSGLSLGLFTISWGGSQMMWLLYPIVTGAVLFINEDIKSIVAAYTPTVLIAGLFAAIVNASRFSFTDTLFLLNIAVLGGLWARYMAEQLELVQERYMPYLIPSLSVLGGIMAILSPLYSDFIASKVISVFRTALQTGGSVITGTVQENAPPGAASLVRSMGSGVLGNVNPGLEFLGMFVSPWTLMVFGVPFMAASAVLMLGRKYGLLPKTVSGRKHTAYVQITFVSWLVFVSALIQNFVFMGAFAALFIGASLFTLIYFLDDESSFTIASLIVGGGATGALIFALRFSSSLTSATAQLVLIPALMALAASAVLRYIGNFPERDIEFKWYTVLPLIWVVSNVFGGTTRSRLVFLSTFSVALAAGYALSRTVDKIGGLDYSTIEAVNPEVMRRSLTVFILIMAVGLTTFSGYVMAQSMGGSPSPSPQVWEPSVDFMQNTPEGSTVLSWWDYGYYFQTLGRTSSVADGGNLNYYNDDGGPVNYRLADYLNSTATERDEEFLEKHSVDYIWLDYSMIGKFSAVSQIAHRDNSKFDVISSARTPGRLQQSLSRDGNQTTARFRGRLGRNVADIYTPIEVSNTSMSISGAPTFRFANGQTAKTGCVLTENGRQSYEVEGRELDYCVAEDPFYSLERGAAGGQSGITLVPQKISNSTFVRLYIQDGWGVDYAEKVPEASNGYIKMWEVDQ